MWNAYLVGQVTPLQSQISTDVLVDGPRKFVVQLPCFKGKKDGGHSHQAGQGDQHRLDIGPELRFDESALVQLVGGVPDLVELDRSIDENTDVVDDETNDLNGVLQAQSIPDKPQLVEVTEHEDGEIRGNGAGFAVSVFGLAPVDAVLELAKDIAGCALVEFNR